MSATQVIFIGKVGKTVNEGRKKRNRYSQEEKQRIEECIREGLSCTDTLRKLGYDMYNDASIKTLYYNTRQKINREKTLSEGTNKGICLSSKIITEEDTKAERPVDVPKACVKASLRDFFKKSKELKDAEQAVKDVESSKGVSESTDVELTEEVSENQVVKKVTETEDEITEVADEVTAVGVDEVTDVVINKGLVAHNKKEWAEPQLVETESLRGKAWEEPKLESYVVVADTYTNLVTKKDLELSYLAYNESKSLIEAQIKAWKNSDSLDFLKEYNIKYLSTKLSLLENLGEMLKKLSGVVENG